MSPVNPLLLTSSRKNNGHFNISQHHKWGPFKGTKSKGNAFKEASFAVLTHEDSLSDGVRTGTIERRVPVKNTCSEIPTELLNVFFFF